MEQLRQRLAVSPPVLPRKRKAPKHLEVGDGAAFHPLTVEDCYRRQYFEVIDYVIARIKERFEQPGYGMCRNLEELLLNAANQQPFADQFEKVTSFYKDDLDPFLLKAQLQTLGTAVPQSSETGSSVSLTECITYLRTLPPEQKLFFSEVCRCVHLLLILPATNAVSERCFSTMRRVKTYLRSTMNQPRLNHLMILTINKEMTEKLDVNSIGDQFVQGSEHRLRQFGTFT